MKTMRLFALALSLLAAPAWGQSQINLQTQVKGTLPVTNGGTGGTTTSAARSSLGLGTLATQNAPTGSTQCLQANSGGTVSGTGASCSGGSVTTVSVASANGFAGTVANATSTPAITLTTSVTGVLKGNGTAISAATSGTDYAPATSGSSILYANGSGGFSSVTIGSGCSFTTGTLACAGTGTGTVTTSGSPASGNLAKFSGSSAITNGDLSGDVTTSGTLATTIANDSVTFAKIQNATAASKLIGSGSSGSGTDYSEITLGTNLSMSGTTLNATTPSTTPWDFSPPTAASFSLMSSDATNLVLTDDTDIGLKVDLNGLSSAAGRFAYRTLTTPASAWDLKVKIRKFFPNTNLTVLGIFAYNSTNNRNNQFGFLYDGTAPAISLARHSAIITFSSTLASVTFASGADIPQWMRIQFDGTNIIYSISVDGKQWVVLFTEAPSAYLTASGGGSVDRVGINYKIARTGGLLPTASVPYFSLTGPGV